MVKYGSKSKVFDKKLKQGCGVWEESIISVLGKAVEMMVLMLAVVEGCGLSRWWGMGEGQRIQPWHVKFEMPVRYLSSDVQ